MARKPNAPATPNATTTTTPETPKTRERRSEVERTAIAVEHAIDALELVGTRVKSWLDGSKDEDARMTFTLVGESITNARKLLKGNMAEGSEIAKLIRDNAPKSARVTDYEIGMFVKVREKYRASFADAVEGDLSSLNDLVVFSVKPAMVGLRTANGDKIFTLRSQIHPADVSEDAPESNDGDDSAEGDTKVA